MVQTVYIFCQASSSSRRHTITAYQSDLKPKTSASTILEPLLDPRHKMMKDMEDRLKFEFENQPKLEEPTITKFLPITSKQTSIILILLNLVLTLSSLASSFRCKPWTRIVDVIQIIVIFIALFGIFKKDSTFLKLVITYGALQFSAKYVENTLKI